MRKIKTELKCRIPSWNYCQLDDFTADGRFSKETCRFCVKTKAGYRCVLHDVALAADENFVRKPEVCIKLTAGFPVDIAPEMPPMDPTVVMREALKIYKSTIKELTKQGYPYALAESLAEKYLLEGRR